MKYGACLNGKSNWVTTHHPCVLDGLPIHRESLIGTQFVCFRRRGRVVGKVTLYNSLFYIWDPSFKMPKSMPSSRLLDNSAYSKRFVVCKANTSHYNYCQTQVYRVQKKNHVECFLQGLYNHDENRTQFHTVSHLLWWHTFWLSSLCCVKAWCRSKCILTLPKAQHTITSSSLPSGYIIDEGHFTLHCILFSISQLYCTWLL